MQPLANVTRNGLIESIHYGDAAVCDHTGDLIGAIGDPQRRVYWRSSAKPIQALSVVHTGAADKFELSDREIAICCASHRGSAEHVCTVRSILDKIDLTVGDLQCGTHPPSDTEERNRLIRNGQKPRPVHNNCSGKHSGMLATTLAVGGDVQRYPEPDSPVQKKIIADLTALSGGAENDIDIGTDGCGLPTHAMSISAMATAFARLSHPENMPERIMAAAPRIVNAMAEYPQMVQGAGGFNSELLNAYQGHIVAKGGAEGLFVLALMDEGIGVAVRAVDGNGRGLPPVIMEILGQLDALNRQITDELSEFISPDVTNCHDEVVGHIRPAEFHLLS